MYPDNNTQSSMLIIISKLTILLHSLEVFFIPGFSFRSPCSPFSSIFGISLESGGTSADFVLIELY